MENLLKESILEIFHDVNELYAIALGFLILIGILYLIENTPRVFKEGLSGLIAKSVGNVVWIFISVYIIKDLLMAYKGGDIDLSVIFVLLLLGALLVNSLKNVHFSLYDLANNNVYVYTGEVEVKSGRYSGRRSKVSKYIILKEYGDERVPITKGRYEKIKDFQYAEVVYYERSKVLISANGREI